jgi:hypothetical protein
MAIQSLAKPVYLTYALKFLFSELKVYSSLEKITIIQCHK